MSDPFSAIAQIAERRITEAQAAGEFDNLPGAGKPLELEDMSHVPEDLRMAWKILKNSGCLPPEIADRKEAATLCAMLDNCPEERERIRLMNKLKAALWRMRASCRLGPALEGRDEYYQKILARLEAHERAAQEGARKFEAGQR